MGGAVMEGECRERMRLETLITRKMKMERSGVMKEGNSVDC